MTSPRRCRASSRDWRKLNPAPLREILILIGGQGKRKTLRLVAEHAHIWHGFTDAGTYPGLAEVLDAHCADTGRDPSAIERSSGVPEKKRRGRARRRRDRWSTSASPC